MWQAVQVFFIIRSWFGIAGQPRVAATGSTEFTSFIDSTNFYCLLMLIVKARVFFSLRRNSFEMSDEFW